MGRIATLLKASELRECMEKSLTEMALTYAKLYKNNGKAFVNSFIKYPSVRSACGFTVNKFEKEIAAYEPDEAISNYVSKLNLQPKEMRLLARTLKMIKVISS